MRLLAVLRRDAARNLHFLGRPSAEVGTLDLFKMMFSPRFIPVLLLRLAHWFAVHHLRPVGKLFSLFNFVIFGLEVGLDCEIGPGLYLPHTSGTVLGAIWIGENAVIYQNVTLGAKTPDLEFKADLRPRIGDRALLGAGCKVLGGITLGDDVTVGANSVVVKPVPSGCLVVGVPAVIVRQEGR